MNPFFNTDYCVGLLYERYKKYGKLIIAADWDDTVKAYREKFDPTEIWDLLKICSDLGFPIVIYTAAPPDRWESMREFIAAKDIKILGINVNPLNKGIGVGDNGKIYYNLLLDDKAGLGQAYEILRQTVDKILQEKL